MAAIPSSLSCICRSYSHHHATQLRSSPVLSFPSPPSHFLRRTIISSPFPRRRTVTSISRAVSEETLVPEEEGEAPPISSEDQTVSVPVSPSDVLTMLFKAEGTMDESATSTVSKALEEIDGISDIKIQVVEGIASVELMKQTTVQATGVASNLVEIIQGSGFKLQALNLSFEDEEDATS